MRRYTLLIWLALALALALGPGCASKEANKAAGPYTVQASARAQAQGSKTDKVAARAPAPAKTAVAKAKDDADEFGDDLDQPGKADATIADPLEDWNRFVFAFNHGFYTGYVQPAARGYRAVVPWEYRTMIENFFYNLLAPVRIVSSLFQGKFCRAMKEAGRFVINSTIGVGGLVDPAAEVVGIKMPPKEDLDQMLATWGVGQGFYIVWPFLGPSSVRGTVGLLGDSYLSPLWYVAPLDYYLTARAGNYFNDASFSIDDYQDLTKAALDPYIAVRNFYVQHRRKSVEE